MLYIEYDENLKVKKLSGIALAKDIKKFGLINASRFTIKE
jgi:hypothetical protein